MTPSPRSSPLLLAACGGRAAGRDGQRRRRARAGRAGQPDRMPAGDGRRRSSGPARSNAPTAPRRPDPHHAQARRRLPPAAASTSDGRGVVAADGAERADGDDRSRDGRIEVAIGGDRFRLPATVAAMTGRIILTAAEMRAAEEAAIAAGTPVETLMERAGMAAAEAIWRFAGPLPALVLCGPGNNGGDGYVIARELRARGVAVRVAALAEPKSDAARAARGSLGRARSRRSPRREPAPLLIDALFGTGLARPLDEARVAAPAAISPPRRGCGSRSTCRAASRPTTARSSRRSPITTSPSPSRR